MYIALGSQQWSTLTIWCERSILIWQIQIILSLDHFLSRINDESYKRKKEKKGHWIILILQIFKGENMLQLPIVEDHWFSKLIQSLLCQRISGPAQSTKSRPKNSSNKAVNSICLIPIHYLTFNFPPFIFFLSCCLLQGKL